MTIRIPGAGDVPISSKGGTGDLLVRVNVAPSKLFVRQGANLYHESRIPVHTALLGGKVRVPTLDGEVDVRIPGGTQQGEEMVLKGRGVAPVHGGANGDLFIAFSVKLPRYDSDLTYVNGHPHRHVNRSLTKRQRELLQQYADDVEGEKSPAGPSSANHGSQASGSTKEPVANDDDNGTTSFTHPPPSSGGWISRTWHKIRGLTGL